MAVDKIRVSGDPRIQYKSATVNGRQYGEFQHAFHSEKTKRRNLHNQTMEYFFQGLYVLTTDSWRQATFSVSPTRASIGLQFSW